MSEPATPPAAGPSPQPHPSAPYGTTPYGTPLAPRTNTLAIVALVLSLTVPLGGIICGHIAMAQIKRTGEEGHGLALAGTIIGYAITGLTVLMLIAYFIVVLAVFVPLVGLSGTSSFS
jgi:hypothetical protein